MVKTDFIQDLLQWGGGEETSEKWEFIAKEQGSGISVRKVTKRLRG